MFESVEEMYRLLKERGAGREERLDAFSKMTIDTTNLAKHEDLALTFINAATVITSALFTALFYGQEEFAVNVVVSMLGAFNLGVECGKRDRREECDV